MVPPFFSCDISEQTSFKQFMNLMLFADNDRYPLLNGGINRFVHVTSNLSSLAPAARKV